MRALPATHILNISLGFVYLVHAVVFIIALLVFFGTDIPYLDKVSRSFVEGVFLGWVPEDMQERILRYAELVFLGAVGLFLVHLIGAILILRSFLADRERFIREGAGVLVIAVPLSILILSGFLLLGKGLPVYLSAGALWVLGVPIYFVYERLGKYNGSPMQRATRFFLAGTALGVTYWALLILLRVVI